MSGNFQVGNTMKALVIVIFLAILASLFKAFTGLVRPKPEATNRTVKSLTWRILLSIGLFVLLMAGYAIGLIKPHSF
jgi:hypothetical protein